MNARNGMLLVVGAGQDLHILLEVKLSVLWAEFVSLNSGNLQAVDASVEVVWKAAAFSRRYVVAC